MTLSEIDKFVEFLNFVGASIVEKEKLIRSGLKTFDNFMALDDDEAEKILSRDLHKKWKELKKEYATMCEEEDWLVYVKKKYKRQRVLSDAVPFPETSGSTILPIPNTVKELPPSPPPSSSA